MIDEQAGNSRRGFFRAVAGALAGAVAARLARPAPAACGPWAVHAAQVPTQYPAAEILPGAFMFIDDELSGMDKVPQQLGRGAVQELNVAFWGEFVRGCK